MIRRAGWIWLLAFGACSESAPPPSTPLPPVPDGWIATGFPDAGPRTLVDPAGRWGSGVRHWLDDGMPHRPEDRMPVLACYRDRLPLPQLTWSSGPYEVVQVVFPAGRGFAARYQVMNHGEEPRACKLRIEGPGGPAAFDLDLEPGVARFVLVAENGTVDVPADALDEAAARWEMALQGRSLRVPDSRILTAYHAALARRVFGAPDAEAALAKIEALLFRVDGGRLRLLGDLPEAWRKEEIDAGALPTPFGPLSFRYSGAFDNRVLELDGACAPPDGFVLPADPKSVGKVDGRDAKPEGGVLAFPAGAKRIELFKPLE
jgi:hypothetical protein